MRRAAIVLPLLLVVTAGCMAPLVDQQVIASADAPIDKIAILPFFPKPGLARSTGPKLAAWEAAALVTRFVSEAIAQKGVTVIPENDVQIAFAAHNQVTPRMDPVAAAEVVYMEFGATGFLLGSVDRYRERSGSSYGSFAPASVAFEVTLYSAPSGKRLWRARFDETQGSLTSDFFRVIHYPGHGWRFLTAAEMARWAASMIADDIPVPY